MKNYPACNQYEKLMRYLKFYFYTKFSKSGVYVTPLMDQVLNSHTYGKSTVLEHFLKKNDA